jgi:hypothetical protein
LKLGRGQQRMRGASDCVGSLSVIDALGFLRMSRSFRLAA